MSLSAFGFLADVSWADAVESALAADERKQKELLMMAETSRDGLNMIFKQTMSMTTTSGENSNSGFEVVSSTNKSKNGPSDFAGIKRKKSEVYESRSSVTSSGAPAGRRIAKATKSYMSTSAILTPVKEGSPASPQEEKVERTKVIITKDAKIRTDFSFARVASGCTDAPLEETTATKVDDKLGESSESDGEVVVSERIESTTDGNFVQITSTRARSGSISRKAKKPRLEKKDSAGATVTPSKQRRIQPTKVSPTTPDADATAVKTPKVAASTFVPLPASASQPFSWKRPAARSFTIDEPESADISVHETSPQQTENSVSSSTATPAAVDSSAGEQVLRICLGEAASTPACAPAESSAGRFASWAAAAKGVKTLAPETPVAAAVTPTKQVSKQKSLDRQSVASEPVKATPKCWAELLGGAAPVSKAETATTTAAAAEELTEHQVAQRQKQIAFGKNTVAYQLYVQSVPVASRQSKNPQHPQTPDASARCSKRAWEGQVRKWRRALHEWDPEPSNAAADTSMTQEGEDATDEMMQGPPAATRSTDAV